MEPIIALSPISSTRRVRKSSYTSLSALANHDHAFAPPKSITIQNAAKSSHVGFPSETAKRVKTVLPVVSRLMIKESMDPISRPVVNNMAFRFVNGTKRDFGPYHGYSLAVCEAFRLLENCARFAKGSHKLSTQYPIKTKTVSTSRVEPPLVRPLRNGAESGNWARRAVKTISKTLIDGPDRTEPKSMDDIVQDFLGQGFETDRHGHVVPTFLLPSKGSKYDVYNRKRFNEDLIFEFEKW